MRNYFSKLGTQVPWRTSRSRGATLALPLRYLSALFLLLTLSVSTMWADSKTYNFDDDVALATDWDVQTTVPSGGQAVCEITNALSGAGFSAQNGKYLGLAYKNKSGITITIVSNDSYDNISNVSFKVVAGDNSKPSFAAYIVTADGDVEVFAAVGSKDGFGTGGTNKWGSKSVALSSPVTGKLKIVTYASSSGKYAAIDDIVITYTPASGGGEDPVCPSGLTISSKDSKTAFTEGDAIELTAALSAGNGDISYQWYKGGTAEGNKLTGKTTNKLQIASCTTADEGSYYCVASKTSCSDAVNSSAFSITVEADTKCFNMPAITSKPADLASVVVTGGTLSDVSTAKAVAMNANGLKLDGNSVYLKVTLADASIIAGTKITVAWKGAGSGAGIAVVNGDLAEKVIDETGVEAAGSVTHTFTAAEAANYADEFIIHRNASGTGIYVNAITVEDCGPAVTKHTITLNYNDGETANGSLTVVDGRAAVKPADPTRGKYTFLGWFVGDTDNEYEWSTAVTGDLTLKAHWQDPWTITFDAGEGSAVADITVKHNTLAEKPADPTWAGHDFNGWTEGGSPFDWTAAITANHALVAEWITEVAKYDVEYYDGETKIGTEEQVRADLHPTATGISTDKVLYTFVGWYLSSTLEGDPVALNTVTPVEGLKLYGKWNKVYASNADFEAYIIANKSEKDDADKAEAYVKSLNYALSTKTGTTFDANDETNNGAYAGLKIKNAGTVLSWNVVAGKVVELKAGVMVANGSLAINSGTPATIDGGSTTSGNDNYKIHYFYSATEALYEFTTSNGSAEVIKAITMRDPYTVSFEAHGDADPSALPGQPSVTLPAATNGTASLLGWFDAETGGNKIGDAGDSYTPTANITLHAQWEAVSTDARLASITLDPSTGVWEPAFDPEVTNYTYTMPYGTAAVPTITGATKANPAAKDPVIDAQAANWNDVAHIHGVAESDDTKDYYITMKIEPKDGVSIIKVATTGGTNKTVTGLYAGDGDVNLSSSKKMDNGKYIGFTLDGTTLQAGDRINVHTTTAANTGGSHIIFYDNMTDKTELYETGEIGGLGDNIFEINAAMIGSATAYVYRSNADAAHQWNGYVDYIEVLRAMNPVLTAITIDGRDGEIDALDDKHFSVTIPYESDLAALTVVPTIVRNAAHPTTPEAVISNEGAWILGDNTYRIMDKDGDYTDYTITLDRDVLKHTVSFNTHGGTAVDPVLVAHGEYLAAAPADPEKEDYIFQGWAETEDGDIVDVTSFTISADKEFHAVWVSDGAIKLLDGATVNHTNFITGVTADETVEFMGNTVNYAKFSGTVSGVNGVKDLTRVIAYNATTNKTKIRISAHNNSTSARTILVKGLVEGASAAEDLASIALGNKEDVISDWIEFDNAANRTIYIMVSSSAGDVYFTQVKVIESGETPMKQVGEVGYSLNFNKGRAFGKADDDVVFEGLNIELIGDYTALNSGYLKMNSSSMSFTLTNPATLHVTASNNKTYYVSNSASGTDNETAKTGVSEFSLSAGTWYINAGENDVQFTEIEFAEPKCAEPVIDAQPLSKVDYLSGTMSTSVTAHAADGSTLSYQWYNADGEVEVVGANAATLNTTDPGTYYVVITATKTGFQSASIQSENATLKYRKADDATLIALTYGAENTAIALVDGVTDYRVTLPEDATVVPALTATPTMAAYGATADVTDADAFVANEAVSTVLVTAEDRATTQEYTVTFVVKHDLDKAEDVTGSTTWNWDGVADGEVKIVAAEHGIVLANYIDAANFEKLEGQDNARAYRSNSYPAYQGTYLKFHTTVPGRLTINARYASGADLIINGKKLADLTGSRKDYTTIVFTGDVVITSSTGEYRIYNMTFEKLTVDYTRPVTSGRYGTICLPNGGLMGCAALYEVAYFDAGSQKIYFDEILDGVMEAGVPYIFLPNAGAEELQVLYTDDLNAPAGHKNGLYGSYTQEELTPNDGNYVLLNNQYLFVNSDNVYVGENRAYIRLNEISTKATPLAPGRRRIAMGVQNSQVATGMENLNAGEAPMKVMINGQLFILRGENMFDATGRLVK